MRHIVDTINMIGFVQEVLGWKALVQSLLILAVMS